MLRIVFFLFIGFHFVGYSQNIEKKQLQIERTQTPPKIDGNLNDVAWQTAQEAKDFIQFRPEVGVVDSSEIKTVVKLAYDDNALYVGVYLHDEPDKIMKQFTTRDNFGLNDFFGIILNPNNDAQNDVELFVFPTGQQADAIASPSIGEDFGWNAVWESAVQLVDDGWVAEMKIPYSCLRFSTAVETWGLQFHRHFHRDRSQYTWNPLDVSKGYVGLYHGELTGIKNIDSPVRLSLYPFASGLVSEYDGTTETDFTLGMDVKYGLTENFTLDATLIPDFSQAGFDDLVLNITPFEQEYAEQRQFFTEGVDLFNKGNLFYSRRVGRNPTGSVTLNENETIAEEPQTIKTLNALKVSGRTKNGWGIGLFNAITETTYAKVKDTLSGETRKQVIEPFSNYNILVVDKQFNRNSSASLINTNVTREGHFRDANVTGLLFNISNKKNTYNVNGQAKVSTLNLEGEDQTGLSTNFSIGKTSGRLRYKLGHEYADTKYDINDMGLLLRNNFNNVLFDISYQTLEATEHFNNYYIGFWYNHNRLAQPNTFTANHIGGQFNATTTKIFSFGITTNFYPGKEYDYFEPRRDGFYFITKNRFHVNTWISTNYNKTLAIDANIGTRQYFDPTRRDFSNIWFGLSPRVRFSDRFLLIYDFSSDVFTNDIGYAGQNETDVIFGRRHRKEMENSLSGSYNFNPLHALTLSFRNYWSTVDYQNMFTVNENGTLQESAYAVEEVAPNINFSTWNLDLKYTWQFAPGSFLTALFRNQLFNTDDASKKTYTQTLDRLFEEPFQNTFSLRLQYFIDYNNVKRVFEKKSS